MTHRVRICDPLMRICVCLLKDNVKLLLMQRNALPCRLFLNKKKLSRLILTFFFPPFTFAYIFGSYIQFIDTLIRYKGDEEIKTPLPKKHV